MTQNTACSLIAATVIAAGFLLGWCAGADQAAPGSPAAGIRGHAAAGARDNGAGAPGPSATVRERTDHSAFAR